MQEEQPGEDEEVWKGMQEAGDPFCSLLLLQDWQGQAVPALLLELRFLPLCTPSMSKGPAEPSRRDNRKPLVPTWT